MRERKAGRRYLHYGENDIGLVFYVVEGDWGDHYNNEVEQPVPQVDRESAGARMKSGTISGSISASPC